ncbi:hypothetical protein KP509_04G054900 [Ceratopteris richardii]|uniref:Uncharacterized protein n=1 Tax=Ceratopteris richardii TaxID=49495 RepID=A0A8T2UVK1_CERRI|nr:hypothetical protein KP509_04G054900 [Ceratopteris richardii]
MRSLHCSGVKEVRIREDNSSLLVCGEGLDENEVTRLVKKWKRTSRVEVSAHPQHISSMTTDESAHEPSSNGAPLKPKWQLPSALHPPPTAPDAIEESAGPPSPRTAVMEPPIDSNRSMKGNTLVTERIYEEIEGVKMRTRVMTSKDICTCIRLEETRLIINKQQGIKSSFCREVDVASSLRKQLQEQNPSNISPQVSNDGQVTFLQLHEECSLKLA